MNSKPVLVFHDLQDICKQKIIANNYTRDFLKTQILLSEELKKIQDYNIQNCKEKLELTDALDKLFEEQCKIFDAFRQEECISIYETLNELNEPSVALSESLKKINELQDQLKELDNLIDRYATGIPDQQAGTQYEVKIKPNTEVDSLLDSDSSVDSNADLDVEQTNTIDSDSSVDSNADLDVEQNNTVDSDQN